MTVLPWALRQWHFPDKATQGEDERHLTTPAFVRNYKSGAMQAKLFGNKEPEVWFNTDLLAQAWSREQGGRVEKRTQTASALVDQAQVLNANSTRTRIQGGGLSYYRKMTGEMARVVIERAEGRGKV